MNKLNWAGRVYDSTLRGLRRIAIRKARFQIATSNVETIETQPEFDMSMKFRILFGPINTAGAAFGWASAARSIPNVDAKSLEVARQSKSKFGFKADIELGPEIAPETLVSWKQHLFSRATHVVLESGFNITENFFERDAQNEIDTLRAHGIKVALLFHGSDIRQPELHAATVKDSYWNNEGGVYWDTVKAKAAQNRLVAETFDGPVFASTPGLVPHVPGGIWLPLSMDASPYRSDAPVLERRVPVVIHVPSNPVVKGTRLIEPILKNLEDEGLIQYRQLIDIPHDEMAEIIKNADVVIDQIAAGNYGMSQLEAMAAGRLVLGSVNLALETVPDLPTIHVDSTTLESTLRSVLADRHKYQQIANEGPAFVEKYHSGEYAANVLKIALGLELSDSDSSRGTPKFLSRSDSQTYGSLKVLRSIISTGNNLVRALFKRR